MSEQTLSLLLSCHADSDISTLHVQLVEVDTGAVVAYRDGSFLLHVSIDTDTAIVRCLVRHIASGDEAHVQSGLNIMAFIQVHLIAIPMSRQLDERSSATQKEQAENDGEDG